jgi:pSer/pThr/pTyr-binding forkhead associated (FHA) protein
MLLEPYQRHLLIIEDDKGSRPLTLEQREYSIGRDRECDIRLVSLFVSRHHATLVRVPIDAGTYSYRIVDGKLDGQRSVNGILVNGAKLRAHNLQDEDEVVFGPQVRFTYHLLKRDPDVGEEEWPVYDEDPTLPNPKSAGQADDRETPEDLLKFPWRNSSREFKLTRIRKGFFNFKRNSDFRPKRKFAE